MSKITKPLLRGLGRAAYRADVSASNAVLWAESQLQVRLFGTERISVLHGWDAEFTEMRSAELTVVQTINQWCK